MPTQIWSRTRTVVNTDPQRRCYYGCNFSERVDHGPWTLFQTWDTRAFALLVAKGLKCDRYEYKLEDKP